MRIIISIISTLAVLSVFSQNQNYLVSENALWSTVEVHCLPNGNLYSSYHNKMEGDSVLGNLTYKKLWRCNSESLDDWFFYGLIREDDQHKVFYKPIGYNEGLIYHFGVEEGDTVFALNTGLNSMDTLHFKVTTIDSVELLDGFKMRIILHEFNNDKEEVWIEGMGSLYGLLNSCNNAYGAVCGGYESLCFEKNNVLIYQNASYNTCHYSALVDVMENAGSPFKIYPNPAKDLINIQLDDLALLKNDLKVELYSMNGKKISEKKLVKNKNALYLPLVNQGFYILRIKSKQTGFPAYKILVD